MTAKTYHHSLYGNRCIVKEWFAPFGIRLFVIGSGVATRKEALKSLNSF